MNNKYIIGATVLAVVLIFSANYFGDKTKVAPVTTSVSSAISVAEAPHDFGDIDIFGGKVRTSYTLKNEGAEDVTVTQAATSCMCTEGEIAGLRFGMHGNNVDSVVIPTGGEEMVTAVFDPLAHGPNGTGPVTRELLLTTNSTESPEIRLKFSANVIRE